MADNLDVVMGKEVFLAMISPRTFSISAFKVAFKDAAHKRGIWHHKNQEGYNCHFRAAMGEVKKLIATAKKADKKKAEQKQQEKKLSAAAPKIVGQQLRLF